MAELLIINDTNGYDSILRYTAKSCGESANLIIRGEGTRHPSVEASYGFTLAFKTFKTLCLETSFKDPGRLTVKSFRFK